MNRKGPVSFLFSALRTSLKFQRCIGFTLEWEIARNSQGEVICEHDPHDPGGATKYGIDQRDHPTIDVCSLTLSQAEHIYFTQSWAPAGCEVFPDHWALAVHDSAVNPGLHWAIHNLQIVVETEVDGIVGPQTIGAVRKAPTGALWDLLNRREAYYRALPVSLQKRYLSGWLHRVYALEAEIVRRLM